MHILFYEQAVYKRCTKTVKVLNDEVWQYKKKFHEVWQNQKKRQCLYCLKKKSDKEKWMSTAHI